MDIQSQLGNLANELEKALAAISSLQELEAQRVNFLGRKGHLAQIMSRLPELSPEERPAFGQAANAVKNKLTAMLEERRISMEQEKEAALLANFDATLPGRKPWQGSLHPITRAMEEVTSVFQNMGYQIVTGPEVDTDFHCFEALNMPPEHPARDMQDTLYIQDKVVLRTHTSTMQVRTMLKNKPPLGKSVPPRFRPHPYPHVPPNRGIGC